MNMRKHIINLLFAAVAFMTGCSESLEDTYSDFAGDGKIRYVAKCSDLDITAGWERLIVNWVNGTDATIDKIKVASRYGNLFRVDGFGGWYVPVLRECRG